MTSHEQSKVEQYAALQAYVAAYLALTPRQHRVVPHPRVIAALQLMCAGYTNSTLSLSLVASGTGTSPCHLTRLLKECTGRGFSFHLRLMRTRHADGLLRMTTLGVKEIAAAVGYESTHAFTRNFRTSRGMTPTEFRRAAATTQLNGDVASLARQDEPHMTQNITSVDHGDNTEVSA